MDEQITQLDRRLTSVEVELASLAAEGAATRSQYATKEDLAKLEARVVAIQSNYVTKEDLAALDSKLSGYIADVRLQIAELELRLVRWLIATVITTSGVVVAAVKLWP
ncbi:MAG: hypothetical protein V4476_25815 [Pseudomonadota bacterium]